ncbi:MAG: hypothetical protein NT086_01165 [Proteobacteria bacterium]|nr:hypothetical protein [Pseudomonadota bacterium]
MGKVMVWVVKVSITAVVVAQITMKGSTAAVAAQITMKDSMEAVAVQIIMMGMGIKRAVIERFLSYRRPMAREAGDVISPVSWLVLLMMNRLIDLDQGISGVVILQMVIKKWQQLNIPVVVIKEELLCEKGNLKPYAVTDF